MRRFLLIVLLAILVGAWICLFLSIGKDPEHFPIWKITKQEPRLTYEEAKKVSQEQEQKERDLFSQAISDQDIGICKSIENLKMQTECSDMVQAGIAQKTENDELCKTLTSTGIMERCIDNVHFSIAEKKKDKELCTAVSDENLQNACKKNIDTARLQEAVESQSVTSELCDTLETSLQSGCRGNLQTRNNAVIFKEATKSRTLESCGNITDDSLKNICRDMVFLDQAIRNNEKNTCQSIINETKKSLCTTQISRKNDADRFTSLVSSGNIADCKTLSDETFQNQCHDQIIINTVRRDKSIDLCESLLNDKIKENCKKLWK